MRIEDQVLLAIICPLLFVQVFGCFWFHWRRKVEPIASRRPNLVLATNVLAVCWCMADVITYRTVPERYPSWAAFVMEFISLGGGEAMFLWRSMNLVLRYERSRAVVERGTQMIQVAAERKALSVDASSASGSQAEKPSSILNVSSTSSSSHRGVPGSAFLRSRVHWAEKPILGWICFAPAIAFTVVAWAVALPVRLDELTLPYEQGGDPILSIFHLSMHLFYIAIHVWLCFVLSSMRDAFSIKEELRIAGFLFAFVLILTMTLLALRTVYPYWVFVSILIICAMCVTTYFPLHLSYKLERAMRDEGKAQAGRNSNRLPSRQLYNNNKSSRSIIHVGSQARLKMRAKGSNSAALVRSVSRSNVIVARHGMSKPSFSEGSRSTHHVSRPRHHSNSLNRPDDGSPKPRVARNVKARVRSGATSNAMENKSGSLLSLKIGSRHELSPTVDATPQLHGKVTCLTRLWQVLRGKCKRGPARRLSLVQIESPAGGALSTDRRSATKSSVEASNPLKPGVLVWGAGRGDAMSSDMEDRKSVV